MSSEPAPRKVILAQASASLMAQSEAAVLKMSLFKWISAFALVLSTVACGAFTGGPTSRIGPNVVPGTRKPAQVPAYLYVANSAGLGPVSNGSVTAYAVGSLSLVRSINTSVTHYSALAVDGSGNLYVSYWRWLGHGTGAVNVFAPGGTTPVRTITDGINRPSALAIDGSGNLFVLNLSGGLKYGSVTVYGPGTTTPREKIRDGLGGVGRYNGSRYAMAFDSAGNLFVANPGNSTVVVFAPGQKRVLRTISEGITAPAALAFDSSDNLYVGNAETVTQSVTTPSSVAIYAPGSTSVLRTITQGIGGDLWALAVDSSDDLYVAGGAGVTVFASGATTPLRTIPSPGGSVRSIALDAAGNLYVKWPEKVRVYAPGATVAFNAVGHHQSVYNPAAITIGP